jgi:hypothetical protein
VQLEDLLGPGLGKQPVDVLGDARRAQSAHLQLDECAVTRETGSREYGYARGGVQERAAESIEVLQKASAFPRRSDHRRRILRRTRL